MSIKIETVKLHLGMGKLATGKKVPGLTDAEIEILNTIGYTGKLPDGTKVSREDYLNSLGKGTYQVDTLSRDNGEFTEVIQITRAYDPDQAARKDEPVEVPEERNLSQSDANIADLDDFLDQKIRELDEIYDEIGTRIESMELLRDHLGEVLDSLEAAQQHLSTFKY